MGSIITLVLQVRKLARRRDGQQQTWVSDISCFPASVQASLWLKDEPMPFRISISVFCSKTSRVLTVACKAHQYPVLAISQILLPSSFPSHTLFAPATPSSSVFPERDTPPFFLWLRFLSWGTFLFQVSAQMPNFTLSPHHYPTFSFSIPASLNFLNSKQHSLKHLL